MPEGDAGVDGIPEVGEDGLRIECCKDFAGVEEPGSGVQLAEPVTVVAGRRVVVVGGVVAPGFAGEHVERPGDRVIGRSDVPELVGDDVSLSLGAG